MNKEIVFVGRMQNKTRDYIHNLEREVKLLQQENQQLYNKIDKAIEYIEKCSLGEDYYGNPVMLAKEDEGKDLLKILKDSEVDD